MPDRKKIVQGFFKISAEFKCSVTLWNLQEYTDLVTRSFNKYTFIFTTVEATYK